MPSSPDNHAAHDYAERIRERLPRRLQELREAARLSKYAMSETAETANVSFNRVQELQNLTLNKSTTAPIIPPPC